MKNKRVLDLNAGLGGRAFAFKSQGFNVVGVCDNDIENCQILSQLFGMDKVKNINVLEYEPNQFPDVEIIVAKYIQQSFSFAGKKKNYLGSVNDAIYEIVEKKAPKCFMLEVPPSTILHKSSELEKYMNKYSILGYEISYQIYDEKNFSNLPVYGKQGYFIGIKGAKDGEFQFPYSNDKIKAEMLFEDEKSLNPWYRKVKIPTDKWEYGKWYIKTFSEIKETNIIHMGMARDNYLVDSMGPRRFTHNELARLKGLSQIDLNNSSNKSRMYQKIAYASNVYIISEIAFMLFQYLEQEKLVDDKDSISYIHQNTRAEKVKKPVKSIIFPKYVLKSIYIKKLKGLCDLELNLERNLVALMGINGAGKSTILHALACTYSKHQNGEDYKFSEFFTPNTDSTWEGSSIKVINHDENEDKDIEKKYEKKGARWANYSSRPIRDVFYLGVDSCIPEIEKEKKTSYINYVSRDETGRNVNKIIQDASFILQKDYTRLISNETSNKKYIGVHTGDGLVYSSLSMGAGEQRVIKLLQIVYNANQYSLILVDEIDLLLHADALKKLIKRLAEIAEKRNLQIIFTTHSLEMQSLEEFVDLKYLEHNGNQILVYKSIKPDLLYELSGEREKLYTVYVEDRFAEAIIKKIIRELNMQRDVSVIPYGAIENSVVIAASKVISGEDTSKFLIVTDGDKYISEDEKRKLIKSKWSGTEDGRADEIENALSMITQFNLPEKNAPEKYIHSLLVEMDECDENVKCAKRIVSVSNSHEWIGKIVEQIGDESEVYKDIMNLVSQNQKWEEYICNVKEWLIKRREEIQLITQ